MRTPLRDLLSALVLASVSLAVAAAEPAQAPSSARWTEDEIAFFEKRIRPVLVQHCYECHSGQSESVKGGLRVDSRSGMQKGGDSGEAVVPGDLDASLILSALRYESYEMPPSGQLSEDVIADFVAWVEMGAPDPRDPAEESVGPASDAAIDWDAARQFWSYRSPERHESPSARNAWVRRPIDGFILDGLRAASLEPSAPAERVTFIRRLTFDLIGLPPTPDEVDAFVQDTSDDADEKLVERLLGSPHYGERWAQLWLDLMRYAEDQAHIVGDNKELFFPNAYLYRDWLIGALNADLPYDEFVRLQLAADLICPEDATAQRALGFIGLGPKYYRRNSPEVMAEEWENQVDTLTRGLLGLTVACARCHDHKYDPIPTEDYYALAGVFASTELYNCLLSPAEAAEETSSSKENGKQDKDKQSRKDEPEQSSHIVRDAEPRNLQVMIRGDVTNLGATVPRRFLRVLCSEEPAEFSQGTSGRAELAAAITSRDNPLTARVIVNRIWGEHFGRPLVGTPSNFGSLGDRPTHPELLDDLAVRFMEHGWSLKWLHRELVLSATYRQSSRPSERARTVDPMNRLLARMNAKRLDIEPWRDAVLAASGRLDLTVGGPSMVPSAPESRRRTVYSERSRFELNRMLALFDFPDPNNHAERRVETITPLQKMFVLNSPFMIAQAEAFAHRLATDAGDDDSARVQRAYRLLFSRLPTEVEQQLATMFLSEGGGVRWVDYAQVLLASNELLIVD
jgi:hypothetical protein